MYPLAFEVLFIFLLMIANGIFAMSEIAVIAARKVRLEQWANEGDVRAGVALELANAPNRFLSTIQVGITLVSTLAGAFGGATIADQLALRLDTFARIAPYSHAVSLALVVLGITYFSLIIGELVPKRLALNNPERIASALGTPMRSLSRIASPVVHLLGLSTDLVLRMLGVRPSAEPPVTEEEIRVLIEQGTQAGMFEEAEQDMVERVFRLGDRRVSALMTPRTKIVWLDFDDSPEELSAQITESIYSRFPVYQGSRDNVLGIIHVKDLLPRCLTCQPLDLKAVLQHPLFVPESMRALKVLEMFKQSGTPIALVIDEYGHIQGMVTLNDVLEAIVGDIPTVDELTEPQAVQREDGSWLLDGMLPVDELKAIFDVPRLPGEETEEFQTLGGFVMLYLERIPMAGEHFEWGGLRFEILDMDGNRVDKVLVMRTHKPSADPAGDI
jgi:putative hemolysin